MQPSIAGQRSSYPFCTNFFIMASTSSTEANAGGLRQPVCEGHLRPGTAGSDKLRAGQNPSIRPGQNQTSGDGPPRQRRRPPSQQQGSQNTSTVEKWDDDQLDLLLDSWEEMYFQHNRAPLSPKHWEDILCKLVAGFPGEVHRTWKACRDKIAKMKTIYRNQKALASQVGAPSSDWKYFDRFEYILSGTAKANGLPRGLDQGVPKPPVEVVDLEVPLSPRRAACLQPGVDGEPNKQFRKTQKRKRDDTESIAENFRDFTTWVQSNEKSKQDMHERLTLRILESEERNRKTDRESAINGQLALASLFLQALKEHRGHSGSVGTSNSADVRPGVPDMQMPHMSDAADVTHEVPGMQMPHMPHSADPEIIGCTPTSTTGTPLPVPSCSPATFSASPTPMSTPILSPGIVSPNRTPASTFPSTSGSVQYREHDESLEIPPSSCFTSNVPSDPTHVQATSTPPPSSEGTCWWWSNNSDCYPKNITDSSSLIDVFSNVDGGIQGSGSKLLHSKNMISTIYGETTMHEALRSSRADGFGALGRQSAAALLNAYYRPKEFPFTPIQVRFKFRHALVNEDFAFRLAREFEIASTDLRLHQSSSTLEGHLQRRGPALHSTDLRPQLQYTAPPRTSPPMGSGASSNLTSSSEQDAERMKQQSDYVAFGTRRSVYSADGQRSESLPNLFPTTPTSAAFNICTADAVRFLDRLQFSALDFWHGYKLYCFGHYSRCVTSRNLFLSSKMGLVVLHSQDEGVTPWSLKFLQSIPDIWAMLEEYVQIRHSHDCTNVRALLEEFDNEEELSTTVNGSLLLQMVKDDCVGTEGEYRNRRNVEVQALEEFGDMRGRLNEMDSTLRSLLRRHAGYEV